MFPSPARTTRHWIHVIFVGWMLLLGHVAGPLHEAQVRHVICPEHGEVLHAGSFAAHGPSDHGQIAHCDLEELPSEPAGPIVLPARSPAIDDHETCGLPTSLRNGSLPTGDMTVERALVACPSVILPRPSDRRRDSIPRLRFAPKQSPPC